MGVEKPLQEYLGRIEGGETLDDILPHLPVFVTKAKLVASDDNTRPIRHDDCGTVSIVPKQVYSNPWDPYSVLQFDKPIHNGQYTLGRVQNASVTIANPTVSKEHAVVYNSRELWLVKDVGSTNGTFVSSDSVQYVRLGLQKEHTLRSMDWIRFGQVETQFFLPHMFRDFLKYMTGLYNQRKKLV